LQDGFTNLVPAGAVAQRHFDIESQGARSSQAGEAGNSSQAASAQVQPRAGPDLSCQYPQNEFFEFGRDPMPLGANLCSSGFAQHLNKLLITLINPLLRHI